MNVSTNSIGLSLGMEIVSSCLNHVYFVLFAYVLGPMPPAVVLG